MEHPVNTNQRQRTRNQDSKYAVLADDRDCRRGYGHLIVRILTFHSFHVGMAVVTNISSSLRHHHEYHVPRAVRIRWGALTWQIWQWPCCNAIMSPDLLVGMVLDHGMVGLAWPKANLATITHAAPWVRRCFDHIEIEMIPRSFRSICQGNNDTL